MVGLMTASVLCSLVPPLASREEDHGKFSACLLTYPASHSPDQASHAKSISIKSGLETMRMAFWWGPVLDAISRLGKSIVVCLRRYGSQYLLASVRPGLSRGLALPIP